ncbi:ROK family protein [Pseudarthrobacter sp. MDT3-26]|uniref:ROK family protein n=1 Tax=Pseudarthrobacter raffinosi TaxID=2953651 RepID=UPI00208F0E3D|nr:ROK family protein [Pseudarthrobacter sp. MDT3-26]MCO4264863.1 ROK family protein [Pseudarthrobacter sp. MDT3-26]
MAFGTGVGGSFVLAGHPVLGHRYAGGHVGHFASPYAFHEGQAILCVCGGAGHVEAIASGPAIREAYVRLGGKEPALDARGVFALAGDSDAIAIKAWAWAPLPPARPWADSPTSWTRSGGGFRRALRRRRALVASHGTRPSRRTPARAARPPRPRAKLGNAAAMVGAARLVLTTTRS